MKDVDFNKAPEGATHIGTNEFFTPWYKLDNGIWFYINKHESEAHAKFSSTDWKQCDNNTPYHRPIREIPRPKVEEKEVAGVPAETKEWRLGELPPIGEKVELTCNLDECSFFKRTLKKGDIVEIIAHMKVYDDCSEGQEKVAVFRHNAYGGAHSVRQAIASCFKRIPTEEEIMKRDLSILTGELSIDGTPTEIGLLEVLYKAGKLKL